MQYAQVNDKLNSKYVLYCYWMKSNSVVTMVNASSCTVELWMHLRGLSSQEALVSCLICVLNRNMKPFALLNLIR